MTPEIGLPAVTAAAQLSKSFPAAVGIQPLPRPVIRCCGPCCPGRAPQ